MTVDDPLAVADEIASLTRPLLVVFDCDGVLAPIVEHPDDSRLLDGTSRLLTDLAAPDDVSVAILSGRSVAGLDQFDFDPAIDVVGSYGNERRGDDGPALTRGERELLQRLVVLAEEGAAAAGDGAHVEHKPASVVLHVRPADPERGASALASTRTRAEAIAGAEVHDGSAVVELMARSADKGTALDSLRAEYRPGSTVYVGDDVPDEQAFARLGHGDMSIRIGHGESHARRRLADPDAVQRMLRQLVDSVSSPPHHDHRTPDPATE